MTPPDVLTANHLIQSSGSAGDLFRAQRVFDHLGERRNLYSWVLIATAYAQRGHIDQARRLLGGMPQRNTVAYRAALSILAKAGKCDEAHEFFLGEIPEWDLISWNTLLSAFGQRRQIGRALEIYSAMKERDVITNTAMLAAFCNAPDLVSAERMFAEMPERDFVAWNSMLAAYARFGHVETAESLFYGVMDEWNLPCCNSMLSAYGSSSSFSSRSRPEIYRHRARDLLTCSMKEHNLVSWNSMLTIYSQCGDVAEAKFLFETMPERSIVSSTAMLAVYVSKDRIEDALELFHRLRVLDRVSSTVMICGLSRNGDVIKAGKIFQAMEEHDIFSMNSLLETHAQAGRIEELLWIFSRRMPEWNLVSLNTVLYSLSNHQAIEDVERFLGSMPERDAISWNIMVFAYSQHGHMRVAERVFHSMNQRDLISWNTLLAGYVLNGEMDKANWLFCQMPWHDLSSWNTLLGGTKNARALALINVLNLVDMPDEISIVCVLLVCNHLGKLMDGWSCFCSIGNDYFLKVVKQHYCSMIDLLGRAGYLAQAEKLVSTMPFLPEMNDWILLIDKNQKTLSRV